MTDTQRSTPRVGRPRLWPAWTILGLQAVLLVLTITPQIDNFTRFMFMMMGPVTCVLLMVIWLLTFSRLRWPERLGLPFGVIALGVITGLMAHESTVVSLWIYGAPIAMLTGTIGLALTGARTPARRAAGTLACIAAGWAMFLLVRVDGFDGSYRPALLWRWQPTHEEMLAAAPPETPAAVSAATGTLRSGPGDWTRFRGPDCNSRVIGPAIATDWENTPPREQWRVAIGPGWSSFSLVQDHLFTQEQRGELEVIVCYDPNTGRERWRSETTTRFSDVVAGAGPRGTPTFADGRIYAMGATARLRCVDAATGELFWQRDLVADLDAVTPPWGFSGSPLVTEDHVVVYAGGRDDHGLVAFERETGATAWHVAGSGMNFASAQRSTVAGESVILFTNDVGVLALEPATGDELWRHTPVGWKSAPMVQPQVIADGGIIVTLGDGIGVARIDVTHDESGWHVVDRWSSRRLKPAFNDFVYFDGALYGFDQAMFTCLDAETGQRLWKDGRYGFGQVLLLESSAALLVTAETGEIILLAADPAGHHELGRVQALEGKTWNHPIVVGNRLFLRNGIEAACFELPAAVGDTPST